MADVDLAENIVEQHGGKAGEDVVEPVADLKGDKANPDKSSNTYVVAVFAPPPGMTASAGNQGIEGTAGKSGNKRP